ncbi:MAG TPA: hypothetical protein DDX33_02095 [Rikenellaceae bacterium]|nr:hypothetical protein [Rikenellaceae bacterium]
MRKTIICAVSALVVMAVGCKSVSEEQKVSDYEAKVEALMESYQTKTDAIVNDSTLTDEARRASLESLYNETLEEYLADAKSVIKKNPSSPVALVALKEVYSSLEDAELEEFIGMIKGDVADTSAFIASLKEALASKKATAEGQMFTDFTIVQDPDNAETSTVKFSDYVGNGKYVLVDFWASWCGPCKREIPNIAAVYDKYRGDDFDVLSVAVWDKPEDTKKAAAEHGVVWNQIINAQKIPTDIYGIEGIPHIMLVGPDGTIVKRDLRGENIEKAVAEALGR